MYSKLSFTILVAVLCFFATAAFAQRTLRDIANQPGELICYERAIQNGKKIHQITLKYRITPEERERFVPPSAPSEFRTYAESRIPQNCTNISSIYIEVRDAGSGFLMMDNEYGNWDVKYNTFPEIVAREQAQYAESQRRAAELQRVAARENAFNSEAGVEVWAPGAKVSANPFNYKGKVVAFRATFVRMISETNAEFNADGTLLVATGVPSTLFTGGDRIILAVRVNGLRPEGGNSIPDLVFKARYRCLNSACSDITG